MSELKATPGEWLKVDGEAFVYALNGKGINRFSAMIDIGFTHGRERASDEEMEANAHLIAAAPDMYQELLEIRDWMSSYNVTGKYDAEIDRIDNVLSKARGEDIQ